MALNQLLARAVTRVLNPSLIRALPITGIVIRSSNVDNGTISSGTPFTHVLPGDIDAGDTLIMRCFVMDNGALVAEPVGWDTVDGLDIDTSTAEGRSVRMFTRVADGTEGADIDLVSAAAGFDAVSVISLAVSGVHADIFDVTPTSGHFLYNSLTGDSPLGIAMTSVSDGAMFLEFCRCIDGASFTAFGATTNWTMVDSLVLASYHYGVQKQLVEDAGLIAAGSWNNTTSNSTVNSVVTRCILKPAAA